MRWILFALCLSLTGCFEREQTAGEGIADRRNVEAQQATVTVLTATKATGTEAAAAQVAAMGAAEAAKGATAVAEQRRAAAQKAKDLVVAQGASNLGPIAAVIRAKELPVYADTILAQKSTIDIAIGLPSSEYPNPQVSVEDLLKDAEASLATYRRDAEATKARLADLSTQQRIAEAAAKSATERADHAEAARREADAKAAAALAAAASAAEKLQATLVLKEAAESAAKEEARNAFIAKCGAGALAIAGPVLLALLNGAAGGGLGTIGSLARAFLPAAGRLRDGLDTARVAVASADVGRAAISRIESMLALAQPELAAKLAAHVATATGGRASSIEDLFKLAAQSHVIDLGGGRAKAVADLVMNIRDEHIDTTGGMPDTLLHLLPKA